MAGMAKVRWLGPGWIKTWDVTTRRPRIHGPGEVCIVTRKDARRYVADGSAELVDRAPTLEAEADELRRLKGAGLAESDESDESDGEQDDVADGSAPDGDDLTAEDANDAGDDADGQEGAQDGDKEGPEAGEPKRVWLTDDQLKSMTWKQLVDWHKRHETGVALNSKRSALINRAMAFRDMAIERGRD